MPREIVTISIGQAGNQVLTFLITREAVVTACSLGGLQIGWRFWDMLTREHAAVQ
jgi:hypothetical protein